jgi:tetratricopeptide (TPR) repeat protein
LPHGEFAARFARSTSQRSIVHNYGAIQALERLLGLLHEPGFILINDYGASRPESADDFQHQRYSQSTFIGINFPLLQSYFTDTTPTQWVEPPEGDSTSIHARLMGRQLAPETVASFQHRFGKMALEQLQEPVQRARNLTRAGRCEAALTAYQQALESQPFDWLLMNEVAQFLTFPLRDAAAGLEMAQAALACNPACSADLWNMLGDSLFELGRIEESREAFLRALQINPDDARARFNLTFVHVRKREYSQALLRIGEALALDKAGTYRERLLQTQADILTQLTQRHQQDYRRMADRISTRLEAPKSDEILKDTKTKEDVNQGQGNQVHRMDNRPAEERAAPPP